MTCQFAGSRASWRPDQPALPPRPRLTTTDGSPSAASPPREGERAQAPHPTAPPDQPDGTTSAAIGLRTRAASWHFDSSGALKCAGACIEVLRIQGWKG